MSAEVESEGTETKEAQGKEHKASATKPDPFTTFYTTNTVKHKGKMLWVVAPSQELHDAASKAVHKAALLADVAGHGRSYACYGCFFSAGYNEKPDDNCRGLVIIEETERAFSAGRLRTGTRLPPWSAAAAAVTSCLPG